MLLRALGSNGRVVCVVRFGNRGRSRGELSIARKRIRSLYARISGDGRSDYSAAGGGCATNIALVTWWYARERGAIDWRQSSGIQTGQGRHSLTPHSRGCACPAARTGPSSKTRQRLWKPAAGSNMRVSACWFQHPATSPALDRARSCRVFAAADSRHRFSSAGATKACAGTSRNACSTRHRS